MASPVGSIPELVLDGQTGLLAETGNAQSFAEAIGRLLADSALRGELGKGGRKHIMAEYTDDRMAEKTIRFYETLLVTKKTERVRKR